MSDQLSFNFEEQEGASAPSHSLERLNHKLEEAINLKLAVDQMEEDLKAAKQQLNLMNTTVIPDMMAELGMEECTQNGWKISVGDFVSGSLPKDEERRAKAVRWLEEHEAGDLLKTALSVNFSRSQHNEAVDLFEELSEEGFAASLDATVHPQTLMAFARERIKNGDPIDTETLGLYTGRVAKYKRTGD